MTENKGWTGHVVDLIVECDRYVNAHFGDPAYSEQVCAVLDEANRLSAHSRMLLKDAMEEMNRVFDDFIDYGRAILMQPL